MYLANNNWENWAGLGKEMRCKVNTWRFHCHRYSAGETGPGRCDDDLPKPAKPVGTQISMSQ